MPNIRFLVFAKYVFAAIQFYNKKLVFWNVDQFKLTLMLVEFWMKLKSSLSNHLN